MLTFYLPLILLLASIATLSCLVIRKIPQLRILDPKTLATTRTRQLKQALLTKRLERIGGTYARAFKQILAPGGRALKTGIHTVVEKLASLEEHYQKLKRQAEGPHAVDAVSIKKFIEEGVKLMKEERYGEAEKRFIEVLSHDSKNVGAYEQLGVLYLTTKQLEQAEEALQFALKIHPKDASVLTRLGEVEMARERYDKAKEYFGKAIEKRANNPRYLDFYIDAAIEAGAGADARRGLEKLRAVNPENKKLAEFAERIITLENKPVEVEKEAGQEEENSVQ